MCLAIPGRISAIRGDTAQVEYRGVSKPANLRLFPDAKVGDRVLVHAGFVIQILSDSEGEELEALISEMMDADGSQPHP